MKTDFETTFKLLTSHGPFPWQKKFFEKVSGGEWDCLSECSLPTGMGKTSILPLWLIALAQNPQAIPRRLVYVVNRRTVVDQTTEEAVHMMERLQSESGLAEMRKALKKLSAFESRSVGRGGTPLAISTLRGQFADNQQWSHDPARPAIVCGTVDMIGSRLLFGGYRIGFRSRPLHAGFLGTDALLVHDEAHLEPAFQQLIERIVNEQERERSGAESGLKVIALSATNRTVGVGGEKSPQFGLTEEERAVPESLPKMLEEPVHFVWKRLKASKSLQLKPYAATKQDKGKTKPLTAKELSKSRVDQIVAAAESHEDSGGAILIFARNVKTVEDVAARLPSDSTKVLTGTMRGYERDQLVTTPVFQRFLPSSNRNPNQLAAEGTVYLVCTSAGEVGVNISADHLVCDLSTFESMAQRFGRVNRFGDRSDTKVTVVYPDSFGDAPDAMDVQRQKTLNLLQILNGDVSPIAIEKLDGEAKADAFAPPPVIPTCTDILFDAWAMTSIRKTMPGRPGLEPYLHGISAWQQPEASVAWRDEVELIRGDLLLRYRPKELLEDYPLKPHELLREPAGRVFDKLKMLAAEQPDAGVWVVSEESIEPTTLGNLIHGYDKDRLANLTLILSPKGGGLNAAGFLDGNARPDSHQLTYDVADQWGITSEGDPPKRQRILGGGEPHSRMSLVREIDLNPNQSEFSTSFSTDDGDAVDDARRIWRIYVQPAESPDPTRASNEPVRYDHHVSDVVARTQCLVAALGLPDFLQEALIVAAELHDLGKRRELFQRSLGNPDPTEWYAKPGKPTDGARWRPRRISTYRHEFGSLLDILDLNEVDLPIESKSRFDALDKDLQDIVLHVIATHHGRARPHFSIDESFDPKPGRIDLADVVAAEVPRRFARLQRKFGRWGLAYLESILRAADWAASAAPSPAKEIQHA